MMQSFNTENFRTPEAKHWPGYFWFINSRLEENEIKRQLQDMARHGAKSVCFHPLPEDFRFDFYSTLQPYLSEEYHKAVEIAVEECRRLGMNFYLYDEGGWPSGNACGLLWKSNPEKYCLQKWVLDTPETVKLQKQLDLPRNNCAYANLVAPNAGERFIELTHQAYAKHIGGYFGNTIRFAFTDEPFAPSITSTGIGWCDDFAGVFQKRKGYDILPYLAPLLKAAHGDAEWSESLVQIKIDYSEVMAALFEERYLLPLRNWCREHHLISGGHFGGEDNWAEIGNHCGHLLRSLRALDFPGVDVIWRQLHPSKPWHPFPKIASSAANQTGHPEVLAELFAVYGAGLQPEEMKSILNYMLLCGINTFIFANIPYSLKGKRMSTYRPHFGPHHPLWKYFDLLHGYAARCSYLMTCGTPVRDTGLFFDMRSFWAGGKIAESAQKRLLELTEQLWRNHCDFDYVDDVVLLQGTFQSGKLRYGDAAYSQIIIPENSRLTDEVQKRIADLEHLGLPVAHHVNSQSTVPLATILPAPNAIRVTRRTLGTGRSCYFLFNASPAPADVTVAIPERRQVVWADCENGCLRQLDSADGNWKWHFRPWDGAFFISGEEASEQMLPTLGNVLQTLQDKWTLRPVRRHYIGQDDFFEEDVQALPQAVALGDWQAFLGPEFSGEAVYSCEFESTGKGAFLQLGKVNYACSVRLNGVELGRKLWAPFVFELKNALKVGPNHLEIQVSNTSANLFTDTTRKYIRENFPPESPYEARQSQLEKASCPSGLFGPVQILDAEN